MKQPKSVNGIEVGSWVYSFSKGIYRVEKIIERYYDESEGSMLGDNKIGDKYKERIIVSKRLLNSKFKKSISYDNCSEYFVSHLRNEDLIRLKKLLIEKPNLLIELNKYKIPRLTTIYNSNLQIDNEKDLHTVTDLMNFVKEGKTFLEIENEILRLDIMHLKPECFGNYNFQLMNYNEEYIDKRRIWRDAKLNKGG